MLEDFDDSVLGDPISYARIEQLLGSESPLSLPVYAWPPSSAFLMDSVIRTVLAPRKSEWLAPGTSVADPTVATGKDRLLESGLPGCPYRFLESGELLFTDGNPAYGLQLHHPRFLELVGAPESARLLDCSPSFWVEELGKEQAMAAAINLQRDAGVMLSNLQILSQFAMAMNRMSFSMMALGLGRSLFPRAEVDALAPAPRAVRAASYMSAMGLWPPQNNPNVPGPVPASSYHSCMNCKYCFPEDRLPPVGTDVTDFDTNLIGSRTQIIVLCFCIISARLPWIMLFFVRPVDVLKGWLDSFSFGCLNVWGLPVKQLGVVPHLLLV